MVQVEPNRRLRELRQEKGLAVFGLGALARVSPSTVSAAERWGYVPGPTVRNRIAEALGVKVDELWPEPAAVQGE